MKSPVRFIKITCTGFIVLFFISLCLFWCRWLCEVSLIEDILPGNAKRSTLIPSLLVPDEIENDPNVVKNSQVEASFQLSKIMTLGISEYITTMMDRTHNSIYSYSDIIVDWEGIYFDKKTGLITYHMIVEETGSNNIKYKKEINTYAGPEGISEIPDSNLGRFYSPVIDDRSYYRSEIIVYDKKMRCFFNIDFEEKSIIKGPQLPEDGTNKPVQIGLINKNWTSIINLDWDPPFIDKNKAERQEQETYTSGQLDAIVSNIAQRNYQYVPILDETGRIDMLNRDTLEFAFEAGYVVPPARDISSGCSNLLAYFTIPLALDADEKYRGMYTASVNREGNEIKLYVFNELGQMVTVKKSNWAGYDDIGSAIYENYAVGQFLIKTRYLLENLHPPILSLASYFTADSFEAGSGHRALFLLPNSFVAMKARNYKRGYLENFFDAIFMMFPSIILSLFLASRISKDAAFLGLAKNERLFWIAGTIAFGLAGYITYRLNRPQITLVTCQNCGKLRRPDMDICHNCKSKWHVPELVPPSWRVF